MKNLYSSSDLARMLNVNESTVKRWADDGYIECQKTKGGHRRFPLSGVLRFLRESGMSLTDLAPGIMENTDLWAHVVFGNIGKMVPALKSAAIAGEEESVLRILRTAVATKPDILSVYEELVFPPLSEIGLDWESGNITVDTEHLASQTIRNALTRLSSELRQEKEHGLIAVCGCIEGELHDIALLCTSHYLSTKGWKSFFLGQTTPAVSMVNSIRTYKPHLVVISAVTVEDRQRFIREVNDILYPTTKAHDGMLAVGGPNVRDRFGNDIRADYLVSSIQEFSRIADPQAYVPSSF